MVRVLHCSKRKDKLRLGFVFIESAQIRFSEGTTGVLPKKQKQVTAGFFSIENTEVLLRFYSIQNAKKKVWLGCKSV